MPASSVEFLPLYGGNDDGPMCYFLTIDGYNILLDCGWNDKFDLNLIKPIKEYDIKTSSSLHPYIRLVLLI